MWKNTDCLKIAYQEKIQTMQNKNQNLHLFFLTRKEPDNENNYTESHKK